MRLGQRVRHRLRPEIAGTIFSMRNPKYWIVLRDDGKRHGAPSHLWVRPYRKNRLAAVPPEHRAAVWKIAKRMADRNGPRIERAYEIVKEGISC